MCFNRCGSEKQAPKEKTMIEVNLGGTLVLEIEIRIKPTHSIIAVGPSTSSAHDRQGDAPMSVRRPPAKEEVGGTSSSEDRISLAQMASIGDPSVQKHSSAPYGHLHRRLSERRWTGEWAHRKALAEEGIVPQMPDYSAPTHAAYRSRIAALRKLVDESDLEMLKRVRIVERSSTPESLAKYRDLAIHALTVQLEKKRKHS
jgi:hypothetical protein